MLFDLGLLQQWATGSHASKNKGKLVMSVVLCDSRFWNLSTIALSVSLQTCHAIYL